jgi:hypothetical protein
MKHRTWDTKKLNTERRLQNTKHGLWYTGYNSQNINYRIQVTVHGLHNMGCGTWALKHRL